MEFLSDNNQIKEIGNKTQTRLYNKQVVSKVGSRFKIAKSGWVDNRMPMKFLPDFGLCTRNFEFTDQAVARFHLPITYISPLGDEKHEHYRMKQLIHDYIYETYYMNNGNKYVVTTELEQVKNPFKSYIFSSEEKIMYTLDVCIINPSAKKVWNIEIDGREHSRSKQAIVKNEYRDSVLESRYGMKTMRIDKEDGIPNYKKIDKFIGQ